MRQNRGELAELLGIDENDLRDYRPRFNIAPTDRHFIITLEFECREAQAATWGLVNSWATDNGRAGQCINAKAKTFEEWRTFRGAFLQRCCVIAADGFYEWTGAEGKRKPLWVHPRAGGLILFAGLYDSWHPKQDRTETTFTIVTCPANAVIAEIHDRMPVLLDERAAEDWMNPREPDPSSLKQFLKPAADDLLAMRPASPLVNSVKNDGPELLDGKVVASRQMRLL